MLTKPVPLHEPEVIQAGARRWHGDTDKVPTTSLHHLDRCRARLTSRYRKADELELMAQALDTLPDHAAITVQTMDCDSSWRSYEVTARAGRYGLEFIGRELSRAFCTLGSGHGDLVLRGPTGAEVFLEPVWSNHGL